MNQHNLLFRILQNCKLGNKQLDLCGKHDESYSFALLQGPEGGYNSLDSEWLMFAFRAAKNIFNQKSTEAAVPGSRPLQLH